MTVYSRGTQAGAGLDLRRVEHEQWWPQRKDWPLLTRRCSPRVNYSTQLLYFTVSQLNMWCRPTFNPLAAQLFNLNFHPLAVVSRRRDPQLQVSENYLDLTKWKSTLFKSCWLMSHLIFNIFKMWYLMC